ncbi:ubiquitin elongating factor core-domain-containing protein, partial [Kickxella alabastrina]|uniref:ubiquitin elongating factor core-domain-containing protein n=1 Tax=Kickxella alabastrina TaxID=61397 RepID=UPI00221F3475
IPDMFPQFGRSGRRVIADALLAESPDDPVRRAVIDEWLPQLAARFAGDDMAETIGPVVSELGAAALLPEFHSLLRPGFRRVLDALDALTSHADLAKALPHMASFDHIECTGRLVQASSALGPFLALSGFPDSDRAIVQEYYADAPERSAGDRDALHSSLRATTQLVQASLFAVLDRLVRAGADERTRTLQFTLRTLATNALRSGMQVDAARVVDDGFADNLAAAWLRLADPFTQDAALRRLGRVDADWVTLRAMRGADHGGLGDGRGQIAAHWRELTRVNADKQLVDAYLHKKSTEQGPPGAQPGFVADCFFAAASALHLGPVATIGRYKSLLKTIGRMRSEIRRYTATPGLLPPAQRASLPLLVQRWRQQLAAMEREKIALDAHVLDPRRLSSTLVFLRFSMCFLLRQVDAHGAFPQQPFAMPEEASDALPDAWRMLPEFLVEDIVAFVVFAAVYAPDALTDAASQVGHAELRTFDDVLPLFVVAFLARPALISNPHLKAKLIDVLHMLTYRDPRESDDHASLDASAVSRAYLVPALLRFYVDVERTGASSQFYDKFNVRYYIARTLRALWARGSNQATTGSAQRDRRVIEEFVARLMTDTTYLLDESLSKLALIRDLETRPPAQAAAQDDVAERLQDAERMATTYVSLAHETVHMLAFLTRLVPRPFQASEVVSRLAAMLNYNLQQLAGPKCSSLRVRDMAKRFSFNPRVLLSELTSVYTHLGLPSADSPNDQAVALFVSAVVEDDRSYSPELFDEAYAILERKSLKSSESLDRLVEFANRCKEAQVDSGLIEFLEDRAPEQYLDPLLASLIKDPVRLPTSGNIMELSAIKGQLLSDPRDPFNRASLTVDMLEP